MKKTITIPSQEYKSKELHNYVVKAKEALSEGKTVAKFDDEAVVFDKEESDSPDARPSGSFRRITDAGPAELTVNKRDMYGQGVFGILDPHLETDNLKINKEIEYVKKQAKKNHILSEKRDEAVKVLNEEIFEECMKNFISNADTLLNEDVIFPTPKYNELTLEPPKPVEKTPMFDDVYLQNLAQKLNEIEAKKNIPETVFVNQSNLEFTDISSEQYRIYEFNNGKTIMIVEPLKLNVSKSGGHRLYDSSGTSHYIPQGWIRVSWKAKPNQPNFVK